MHTQCPECQTAFRVTAGVLRQAHGQVRCGSCDHAFYALEHLFDDPSGSDSADNARPDEPSNPPSSLLDSLTGLADDRNVHIEDTGVEWRVLDMDDGDSESDGDAASNDETTDDDRDNDSGADWSVERPLDLTAAEDDDSEDEAVFAEASDLLTVGRGEDDSDNDDVDRDLAGDDSSNAHRDAALEDSVDDFDDDNKEKNDSDVDDEAGGNIQLRFDDDTPLPEEFYNSNKASESWQPENAELNDDDGEEALRVAIDTGTEADWRGLLDEVEEPAASPDEAADDAQPDTVDERPEETAVADAVDDVVDRDADSKEEPADELPDESGDDNADDAAESDAALALDDADEDSSLVESIVMEGETVTDLLERAEHASYENLPPPEFDDDTQVVAAADAGKQKGRWGRVAGFVAIVLLILALAAQLVHANREALATQPLFQKTIGPVYDALGQPVNPAWNIRGWQFESTSGNTDDTDQHLSIYTRIANHSPRALPYPLLHVSLTDRFDEVIGSRMLQPREYLAGAGRPNRPLAAGGAFTAVITVNAPSPAATGFKLNVCYPMSRKRVRCAIEDFRD